MVNENKAISIYLSKHYDMDLICFYHKIGKKSFNKIMRCSLLSLKDSSNLIKIKSELTSQIDDVSYNSIEVNNVLIRLNFSGENAIFIQSLVSKIKKRQISTFVKQLMRYFVGFENLMSYYLDSTISFEKKQVTRLEISGLEQSIPKPKKPRTKNKVRATVKNNTNNIREDVIASKDPINPVVAMESNIPEDSFKPDLSFDDIDLSFDEYSSPSSNNQLNSTDDFDPLAALMNLID